ncbi:hypothetical protein COCSUDRAFT_60470 [Coccomyxa subellipsoidea C-169]|uniref:Uncharacterized protein n=1 Tax=Coccomyxa subellipsoidea (strain C-169) TaxID=574566 RepID=I0YIQ9_COCSC|nr:hypothetical protein COCSUDRAFT_60470 [Coccomyxa subellipsoidea C-169]EIE18278.1 hypothetical protein COCSUDRAFT_60470 [Coccomyxa subellipsoidea C-169]|eukprot:XP_005642822.1 hypothetical protein COCSUDRAFT_60470 [Coccomyxa subellipsoidea C-169]
MAGAPTPGSAHEVVEVDGFLFKRKRRVPLGESANVPASAKKAKTQQKPEEGQMLEEDSVQPGPKGPAPDGAGREGEVSDQGDLGSAQVMGDGAAAAAVAVAVVQPPPAVDVVEAAHAALASLPAECSSENDRLLALCEILVQDEIRRAKGQPGVELLQKALATFMDDIRVSLGNGTLQCGDDASAAAAGIERQQKLRAELETQKTVLTARLERFQKEEAEWNELLQGGTTEDSNAAADGDEAATPAEAAAAAAEAEGDAVAAEAAAAADGELPSGQKGAGSGEAPAEQTEPVAVAVEGLCAMVEGVRELVETAEQITSTEFDKLYKEKFSALPGLNSPARLIREIVRPPRSRLHAASSAAADAAEASPVTPL